MLSHLYEVSPRLWFSAPPLALRFSLSVGDPFWLASGPARTTWCWKVTPVYCACQEANTIYCTLAVVIASNRSTLLFAVPYGHSSDFGVVSFMVLPRFIHNRSATSSERPVSLAIFGWSCQETTR